MGDRDWFLSIENLLHNWNRWIVRIFNFNLFHSGVLYLDKNR